MTTSRTELDPRAQQRKQQPKRNHQIRVPEVRLVGADGALVGVVATPQALALAQQEGLDLIEINPKATPPVCKILDFGRFKYETAKQSRSSCGKRAELKEIKLRPKTDDHDLECKSRAARRFLDSGDKVKFTVRFRGREIAFPQIAQQQLDWLVAQLGDIANVEGRPQLEGRSMTLLLAPRPGLAQRKEPKAQRPPEPRPADTKAELRA